MAACCATRIAAEEIARRAGAPADDVGREGDGYGAIAAVTMPPHPMRLALVEIAKGSQGLDHARAWRSRAANRR
jgi:hypothetical protein